jgi:hypothetical protein
MINLNAADDFLKELEEKKKTSEKSEIEGVIREVEQSLDKVKDRFDRLELKLKNAGIGGTELTKIKKEIKDAVGHILMIY